MARGQLPKAYLRIDPNLDQHPEADGMLLLICAAARQARRGRFPARAVVDRILGRKRADRFIAERVAGKTPDLIQLEDGSFYLSGWDEWNEGDYTVGDRMARIRDRRSEGYSRNKIVLDPSQNSNPPSEAVRQQDSKAETDSSWSSQPPRKLSKKSLSEYDRLRAEPEIEAFGLYWVSKLGGDLTLGLLRATRTMLAAAYSADMGRQAIDVLVAARDHPEWFDPRGSARWTLDNRFIPEFVLRPGQVEKIAIEHVRIRPETAQQAAPDMRPARLRERDDIPATREQIEAAKQRAI